MSNDSRLSGYMIIVLMVLMAIVVACYHSVFFSFLYIGTVSLSFYKKVEYSKTETFKPPKEKIVDYVDFHFVGDVDELTRVHRFFGGGRE